MSRPASTGPSDAVPSLKTTPISLQTYKFHNRNQAALAGRLLLVVENLSDPNVVLSQPDGYLGFGQPFLSSSLQAQLVG